MLRQFFCPVFPEGHSRKSVYSRIWKIYYPAAMEFALLQLVSMFDQIQVGGIGAAALAAVGIANQVKMVLVTVFISVNIGVTALVAHSSGAGEHERIPKAVSHGLILTFIMSASLSTAKNPVLCLVFSYFSPGFPKPTISFMSYSLSCSIILHHLSVLTTKVD